MSTMPGSLRMAIDQMIGMLRSGQYAQFLEEHVDPVRIIDFKTAGTFHHLVTRIEKRAEDMLKALESIRDRSPELNQAGTNAVFTIPNSRDLVFKRVGEKWYLMN